MALSEQQKIEFFKYLNRDISIAELENYIYADTSLEQNMGAENYLSLVSLNFKDSRVNFKNYILENIIDEGEYETWKLKDLLTYFINNYTDLDNTLDLFYRLYCGDASGDGLTRYRYKFLANLGLNYMHWAEEGYLKTMYGQNWQEEYNKIREEGFEFYHKQLTPFAVVILAALNDGRIQIFNNGTYAIESQLKLKLESDTIYGLKHPPRS